MPYDQFSIVRTTALPQSLEGLDLPDFVHQAIDGTQCQETFDRLIIYTDGSSTTNSRLKIPDTGNDPNEVIDSRAFAVLGETYGDNQPSTIAFLGWHTQQILYDPTSPQHAGAQFSGSFTAEREALLWAMIWRIGIDSPIPTVFRPDSRVTGAQANGDCGATVQDYGFRMLRSTYQILEAITPDRQLQIDWTPGHCGDPWNELVDVAAKTEGRRSFYMNRVNVDLRHWEDNWFYIWMVFEKQAGLPQLTAHGFDVSAPDLPDVHTEHAAASQKPIKHHQLHCRLSMATGNVKSLYTGPTGHAGKLHYLQAQLKLHCLNFLGIQESRAGRCSSNNNQVLRLAGGGLRGHFGVELWVHLDQPYGEIHGHSVFFREQHFAVVHADPRCMLVKVHTEHLEFWIVVAHAPQSGQCAQDRHDWWTALQQLLHKHLDGSPLFGLFDANAGSGPSDHHHIYEFDGPVTPNTEDLRAFLQTFDLYLPSTTGTHHGEHETWISPDGQTQARIDYVILPLSMRDHCAFSAVIEDFDLGQLNDHKPAAVELEWSQVVAVQKSSTSTRTPKYNRAKIGGQRLLQDLRAAPWTSNIETHVEDFNTQVHRALQKHCRSNHTNAKKPYLTPEIWQLRQDKLQSRAALKLCRRQLDRQLLLKCLQAWAQHPTLPEASHETDIQCERVHHFAQFQTSSRQLRQQLRISKQASLNQAFAEMPDKASASYILQVAKEHSGPTNVKKIQKRPLPFVEDATGQPCTSPEAVLDRWIQFFCDMEGGERCSTTQQRRQWIDHLASFRESQFQITARELPSLVELETAFRRVANGKATGPDGIPSEACRYNAAAMAKATYTQLVKLLKHGQEHLGHKGGRLVKAWKGKGSQSSCAAYRSLLISCHPGKVLHRALRMHQSTLFEAFLQTQQIGGRRGVPVQLGLHLARSFQRWQLAEGAIMCHNTTLGRPTPCQMSQA